MSQFDGSNGNEGQLSKSRVDSTGDKDSKEISIVESKDNNMHGGSSGDDIRGMDDNRRSVSQKDIDLVSGRFNEAIKFIESKGCRLLSEVPDFRDLVRKITLKKFYFGCDKGHKFWKTIVVILHDNSSCSECFEISRGNWTRKPIEKLRIQLLERGFKLKDSSKYKNMYSKIKIEHIGCDVEFESSWSNLRKMNKCSECSDYFQHSFKEEQKCLDYVNSRGGKLLMWGEKMRSPCQFECGMGHRWATNWSSMQRKKSWCSRCRLVGKPQEDLSEKKLIENARKCLSSYIKTDLFKERRCDLTLQDVIDAKKSSCTYCNRVASGFDRIDNSVGHLKKNCIPACIRCNWTRGNWISHEVMLQIGTLLKEIDP